MTDISKVRLLIGDTGSVQFTDAQIQMFLDLAGGSVLIGAAFALEAWAASETSNLDSENIGDYAYTRGAVNKKITLAKEYKKEAADALAAEANSPYLTWAEMDLSGVEDTTIDEDIE